MTKYKKLLLSAILLLTIFVIYILNSDKKINYIALGDSLAAGQNPYGQINYGYTDYVANYLEKNGLLKFYTKEFAESGYRSKDLLQDIRNDRYVTVNESKVGIKKALRESDLVTISIGANDFLNAINLTSPTFELESVTNLKGEIDEVIKNVDETIKEIRKYAKRDIIVIGYYNPLPKLTVLFEDKIDSIMDYTNDQYKKICKKYDITYIDINQTFKNNHEYLPNPIDIHPGNKGYEAIANKVIDVIEKNIIN